MRVGDLHECGPRTGGCEIPPNLSTNKQTVRDKNAQIDQVSSRTLRPQSCKLDEDEDESRSKKKQAETETEIVKKLKSQL